MTKTKSKSYGEEAMIDSMKQARLQILVSRCGELGQLAYDIIHSHLDAAHADYLRQAKERYAVNFAGGPHPTTTAYLKTVAEVFDDVLEEVLQEKQGTT
jgi:hypothetical protein